MAGRRASLLGVLGDFQPLEAIAVVVDRHHAIARLGTQVELLPRLADVRVDPAGGPARAAGLWCGTGSRAVRAPAASAGPWRPPCAPRRGRRRARTEEKRA